MTLRAKRAIITNRKYLEHFLCLLVIVSKVDKTCVSVDVPSKKGPNDT